MTDLNALADLRSANIARQAEWDKDSKITLAYRGNELAGEVGEACNVIKKIERERLGIAGSRDTVAHLAEELADVVICADLIAMQEGIDLLGSAVPEKFNATSEKVGLKTRLRAAASSQAGVLAMREKCKQVALAYAHEAVEQIERNNEYYRRSGTKDTGANAACRSTKFTADFIAAAIDNIDVQAGVETATPAQQAVDVEAVKRAQPAIDNLINHQEQCDQDGVMVKVSRQALDEVLALINGGRDAG